MFTGLARAPVSGLASLALGSLKASGATVTATCAAQFQTLLFVINQRAGRLPGDVFAFKGDGRSGLGNFVS